MSTCSKCYSGETATLCESLYVDASRHSVVFNKEARLTVWYV